MTERIAFIGLSGPLFYDYRNQAKPTEANPRSSPNPVLAAPNSLVLLYDQIWFLCRALCPDNMRELPYVFFVDEMAPLKRIKLDSILNETRAQLSSNTHEVAAYENIRKTLFAPWHEIVAGMGVAWPHAFDNHSHALKIGDAVVGGNSAVYRTLLTDMAVVSALNDDRVELIPNPYLEAALEQPQGPGIRLQLSETLVVDRIPNALTPKGPACHRIEEMRHNPNLSAFRKWLATQKISFDPTEVAEFKEAVERTITEEAKRQYLAHINHNSIYFSSAKTALNAVVDTLVTGGLPVLSAAENIWKSYSLRDKRWHAFLLELEREGTKAA